MTGGRGGYDPRGGYARTVWGGVPAGEEEYWTQIGFNQRGGPQWGSKLTAEEAKKETILAAARAAGTDAASQPPPPTHTYTPQPADNALPQIAPVASESMLNPGIVDSGGQLPTSNPAPPPPEPTWENQNDWFKPGFLSDNPTPDIPADTTWEDMQRLVASQTAQREKQRTNRAAENERYARSKARMQALQLGVGKGQTPVTKANQLVGGTKDFNPSALSTALRGGNTSGGASYG